MYKVDYNSYRAIKSYNHRVRFLVMHYTATNFQDSINALTGPSVSAHYLVPDPSDQTYIDAGFKDLRIFNLVAEHERAWHAGVSSWAGRHNLNDTSIGIEIVNQASIKEGDFIFPPYHPAQIEAIKELIVNILQRYPDIIPVNVVGHADISPGRKSDPGAAFPWKDLYDAGIGAWYDEATRQRYQQQFSNALPAREEIIIKLGRYGYGTSNATTDGGYNALVRAFQLHFRPQKYDGVMDSETASILFALTEKYFPAS